MSYFPDLAEVIMCGGCDNNTFRLMRTVDGIFKAVCPNCNGFIDGYFNTEGLGDTQIQ